MDSQRMITLRAALGALNLTQLRQIGYQLEDLAAAAGESVEVRGRATADLVDKILSTADAHADLDSELDGLIDDATSSEDDAPEGQDAPESTSDSSEAVDAPEGQDAPEAWAAGVGERSGRLKDALEGLAAHSSEDDAPEAWASALFWRLGTEGDAILGALDGLGFGPEDNPALWPEDNPEDLPGVYGLWRAWRTQLDAARAQLVASERQAGGAGDEITRRLARVSELDGEREALADLIDAKRSASGRLAAQNADALAQASELDQILALNREIMIRMNAAEQASERARRVLAQDAQTPGSVGPDALADAQRQASEADSERRATRSEVDALVAEHGPLDTLARRAQDARQVSYRLERTLERLDAEIAGMAVELDALDLERRDHAHQIDRLEADLSEIRGGARLAQLDALAQLVDLERGRLEILAASQIVEIRCQVMRPVALTLGDVLINPVINLGGLPCRHLPPEAVGALLSGPRGRLRDDLSSTPGLF